MLTASCPEYGGLKLDIGEPLVIAGERGGGRDSWLGFRGMLYKASAKSAARFRTIS